MILPALCLLFFVSVPPMRGENDNNEDDHALQSNLIGVHEHSSREEVAWTEVPQRPDWPGEKTTGGASAGPAKLEGCGGSGLCCQGKDNNCSARGRGKDGSQGDVCYCDSNCLTLGDCCWDYAERCPAVDCQLGSWAEWSVCDSKCGFGVRQRSREVIQRALNGGSSCEATNQKQVCEGTQCKLTRDSESGSEMRETGRILPLEFSRWRNDVLYDPYKDIRRHIFFSHKEPFRPVTCSSYSVRSVPPTCSSNGAAGAPRAPTKGQLVCVECHPTATLDYLGGRCFGQGLPRRETRWSLLGKPGCRGTWAMEGRMEECTCQSRHPSLTGYSFV